MSSFNSLTTMLNGLINTLNALNVSEISQKVYTIKYLTSYGTFELFYLDLHIK